MSRISIRTCSVSISLYRPIDPTHPWFDDHVAERTSPGAPRSLYANANMQHTHRRHPCRMTMSTPRVQHASKSWRCCCLLPLPAPTRSPRTASGQPESYSVDTAVCDMARLIQPANTLTRPPLHSHRRNVHHRSRRLDRQSEIAHRYNLNAATH